MSTEAATGLEGTRAVVTGAASGIGRATALLLLERGASVVAADRDESGLAAAVAAAPRPVSATSPSALTARGSPTPRARRAAASSTRRESSG